MINNKLTLFIKILLISSTMTIWLHPIITFSNNFLNEEKIKYDLKNIQKLDNVNINQKTITDSLQTALHFIEEQKISDSKIKEYQEIIDNFSCIVLQLQEEYDRFDNTYPINTYQNLSAYDLKKKISQISNQSKTLSNQLKQETDQIQSIHESLRLLPKQQISIKNILHNLEQQRYILYSNVNTPVEQAKFIAYQAKQIANRLKITELELAQLSASNRKELSKLRIALLKKKYDYINDELQILRNQLNSTYYRELYQEMNHIEKMLSKDNIVLPKSIKIQLQTNHHLLLSITQQTNDIKSIHLKKREIDTDILQVRQTFVDLIEQSQWVDKSPALGETLRAQIATLPKLPKFQQLNNELAQLRAERLQHENDMHRLSIDLSHSKQDDGSILTLFQKNILKNQLNIQRKLIRLLLNNLDIKILELTKLKISYEQLKNALQEIQQAIHRYLFWVADAPPINLSYPLNIYRDIYRLCTDKMFHKQMISALYMIFNNQYILILSIFYILISIGLHLYVRHHYYEFLEQSSKRIGKVNQDNFIITFYNICSSIFMATPIPVLWIIIGHNLNHAWPYPIIIAVGDSMNSTAIILWILILSSYFASPKGLFIMHFGWPTKKIRQVFSNNYSWSIAVIIFLTTALTVFNNYNHREFSNTLGRLCFILLCLYLTFITNNLKQSGFPLYLNKYDSANNIINHFLWNVMIAAPITATIACACGYLFAAQALLSRLETSFFIWALLLIIYYIIRRWMFIQRRRIAFKRAKKKRAEQLILRTCDEYIVDQQYVQKSRFIYNKNNKKNLDLDTISTKSLHLIRSTIILIAVLLMTVLWSELHSAFLFLENITLWDVTSTIKGIDNINIQPITLKTVLTIIVVIVITTIMVRNLPAFLELTLLQHLHLTTGTAYAITTSTKYILMLFSGLIGLSLIGIEWSKIQWLIAALGVGLGFGLQEIFANFISGLMILFEKPIRIGDTITIQDITGNVTRINTRATTITDWNHKEVIIPNKEFITKQFVNWSLSDTITRVILRIPVPIQTDVQKMIFDLTKIIKRSPLALNQPEPEVFLISLQHGLPILEIRTYTKDIKSRIPLCHHINIEIINYLKNNKLQLPYLTFCYYKEFYIKKDLNLFNSSISI